MIEKKNINSVNEIIKLAFEQEIKKNIFLKRNPNFKEKKQPKLSAEELKSMTEELLSKVKDLA